MRLKELTQYKPLYCKAVFEKDGETVEKILRSDQSYQDFLTTLMRRAREADRDFAFMKHGDDWREHVQFTDNFWNPLSREEFDKLCALPS